MSNDWTIKNSEKTQGVHQNWASLESNQFKARKRGILGTMEHSQLLPRPHAMGQAHPSLKLFLSWWGSEVTIMMLILSYLLISTNYDPNVALKNPKTEWLSTSFPFRIILLLTDQPQSPEIWLSPSCLFYIKISSFQASWIPSTRVVAQWWKVPWAAWCSKCPFLRSTNIY